MPLLTHDETGASAMARVGAVALAERTAAAARAAGDGPEKPPKSRWRRMRPWVLGAVGVFVLGPFVAFVIGWMFFKVPTIEEAAGGQVAVFNFADAGPPIATVQPGDGTNRVKVAFDQIPPHVREAVLAAEDRTFYSNAGFDPIGIVRAAINQILGIGGGGSTITQQYIKVSTGQDQFSLWRKYKEVVLAVKISREQSKDQILENYLNTIYLGRGTYSIQSAAKAYFGKDVGQLSISEGALIAGIIQGPSLLDPMKNRAGAEDRWKYVLDQMVESKWITQAERNAQKFPTVLKDLPEDGGVPSDDRYKLYQAAKQEMLAHGITQEQIDTAGLTVTTTVRHDRQGDAVNAVKAAMKGQPANLRTSLVSVDTRTGAILAYYGGTGFGTDYAQALRQPGSSFKPFVFAAALQGPKKVGLGTIYNGASGQTIKGQKVDNSEGVSCDACDVKTAMTKSINTVFYQMAVDAGIPNVIDAAHALGIPKDLLTNDEAGIALGADEVHPVDMAGAFGTLAANGVRHDPYLVSRVVAADGRVLYERPSPVDNQAVSKQVARNVTESMLDVAASSRIALSDGRPVAAKTGTVQLGTTKNNKDAWTVGYTPSISTAVWVGSDLSEPIFDKSGSPMYGRMVPGSIWQQYMNAAVKGTKAEQFSTLEPMNKPIEATPDPGDLPDGQNGDNQDRNNRNRNGNDGNGNGTGGLGDALFPNQANNRQQQTSPDSG